MDLSKLLEELRDLPIIENPEILKYKVSMFSNKSTEVREVIIDHEREEICFSE